MPSIHPVLGHFTCFRHLRSRRLSSLLKRLPLKARAIVYRLLPKGRAVEVFELLSSRMQSDLIRELQDAEVAGSSPISTRMTTRVDPAVFSNPFISTFVDAAGLIVYFLIAGTVLGLSL